MPRPTLKIRRLFARLALAAAATCAALLLAEVLLRVFVEQETKRLATYDRELGWRGIPHARGWYIRHKDGIRVPFAYNNCGFRDEDIEPKPRGTLRVLMLGDSFLESLEVAYEQIFHDQVEQRLPAKIGKAADVVAVGSQGYSNAQELLAFRRYKDLIGANIVLSIVYTGNDFEDNLRRQFAYLDEQGELHFPENRDSRLRAQYQTLKRWLYEHSHLAFLAKNRLESWAGVRLAPASKADSTEDEDYKRRITTKILSATKSDVEASGADFAVVIIPSREEVERRDFRWITGLVESCTADGTRYLDLSRELTTEHYFATDIHLNPAGHTYVANRLCDFLASGFPTRSTADIRAGETTSGLSPGS
jgi:hypothetical protein